MDIDQVLEVPDTPDRLASQNINGTRCMEKDSNSSAAGDSENARFSDDGFANWPRCRTKLVIGKGHSRSLSFRPSRNLSISGKSDCHINSTVPTVGNSSSLKNTHLCRRTLADQNPKYEKKQLLDSQHMEKGKSWHTSESSACQEDNDMVDLTEQNKHAPVFRKAVPHEALGNSQVDETRKGSMSTGSLPSFYSMSKPPSSNASKGKAKVEDKGKVSLGFDHQKILDIHCNSQPKAGNTMSASLNPITSGRVIGQKRLVRNGCISPHNIAKARQSAEKHNYHPIDVSKTMASDCPVNPADVNDFICKGNNSYMVKGKGIIEHPFPLKEPETKTTDLFSRSSTISEKAKETCDATGDAFRCVEGLGRWRSTRNRTKTNQHHGNRVESRENRNGIGNRTGDDCTSFRDAVSHQCGSASPPAQKSSDHMSHFGQIDGHDHAERKFTKRQKQGSTLSNQGECSMSSYSNSEIVFLGSSGEPSNSRPTRNQSRRGMRISNPVIEIDEFSPGTRNSGSHNIDCSVNDDSDVRARQVEADELLARELQEQLYNEVTGFGVDEIDTHIALALQQEENSRNSFSGGTRVFHPSGSLVSNLYRRSQSRPSRNPSIQRGTQPRVPTSTRMAHLRGRLPSQPRSSRTPLFPPSMDVDMRIHILETLEAFSDMEMATAGSFVQVQRDFNENDYEMLLALDENNHSVGASLNQINGLPQSTVQTNNFEEVCAICLETPTTGDTIRHLPCLHKFHKDCIDPWLQRRTTCPVCKSSIT